MLELGLNNLSSDPEIILSKLLVTVKEFDEELQAKMGGVEGVREGVRKGGVEGAREGGRHGQTHMQCR